MVKALGPLRPLDRAVPKKVKVVDGEGVRMITTVDGRAREGRERGMGMGIVIEIEDGMRRMKSGRGGKIRNERGSGSGVEIDIRMVMAIDIPMVIGKSTGTSGETGMESGRDGKIGSQSGMDDDIPEQQTCMY